MDKISTHTEEEKFDAKFNEKRVTNRYIERRNRNRKRRPKRKDVHHNRKSLVGDDPDTGSNDPDLKVASLKGSLAHNVVINWLLMGRTSHIFK